MKFKHNADLMFPRLKQVNSSVGRVYLIESGAHTGDVYPSITRILGAKPKPALEAWEKRVGKAEAARVRQTATVQGAGVHKLAECYLGNELLPDATPNVKELWRSLHPWLDEHITTVFAQEQDIYSHKLKVAGRMDLLAEVDHELAVVDIKTSKSEKKEDWIADYFLQATFYAVALYETMRLLPNHIYLPIVSPYGLQVFHSTPAQHFAELRSRIAEFYLTYEAA